MALSWEGRKTVLLRVPLLVLLSPNPLLHNLVGPQSQLQILDSEGYRVTFSLRETILIIWLLVCFAFMVALIVAILLRDQLQVIIQFKEWMPNA